jgi:antitoxin component HigA of HigAB toxin-antitoxin module
MRTNFEDVNTSQWLGTAELIGFLTEMNMVEATYKALEIPVPLHYEQKREEIVAAIKTSYRVDMLKEVLTLESKANSMKTVEEQRAETTSHIETLKRRLGITTAKQIEPGA